MTETSEPTKPKRRKPKYYKPKRGPKKKGGRPRRKGRKTKATKRVVGTTLVPYEMAKYYIQNLLPPGVTINTRLQYREWYDKNRIRWMPYDPNKAYKEWTSWNDFLGNTNSFEDNYIKRSQLKQQYLPYWEAVSLAQQLAKAHKLTAAHEYRKFHKENPSLVSSLPRAPNVYYADWLGWPTWLGKTVSATLLPQQHMEQYYLVLKEGENLYSFYITTGGKEEAKNVVSTKPLVKAYVMDENMRNDLQRLVEINSQEYDESTRYCANINGIIYVLDTMLITFRG